MSDTNKCPVCDAAIAWTGEMTWCKKCDWISPLPSRKEIDFKYAYLTATQRIRELEARIKAKDEALCSIANGAIWYKDVAQEALNI